jgi:hypothetical protein
VENTTSRTGEHGDYVTILDQELHLQRESAIVRILPSQGPSELKICLRRLSQKTGRKGATVTRPKQRWR